MDAKLGQANLDWHVGVAVAGHNELLIGFMTATSITDAIRDGDAEAAGRRMRRHVHSYAAAALKVDQRDSIIVDD